MYSVLEFPDMIEAEDGSPGDDDDDDDDNLYTNEEDEAFALNALEELDPESSESGRVMQLRLAADAAFGKAKDKKGKMLKRDGSTCTPWIQMRGTFVDEVPQEFHKERKAAAARILEATEQALPTVQAVMADDATADLSSEAVEALLVLLQAITTWTRAPIARGGQQPDAQPSTPQHFNISGATIATLQEANKVLELALKGKDLKLRNLTTGPNKVYPGGGDRVDWIDTATQDLKAIAEILEDARLEGRLRSLKLSSDIVRALAQLATQAVAMGIDYKTLGIGWHHPSSRTSYRRGEHRSTRSPASRQRQKASKARLVEALASAADFKLLIQNALPLVPVVVVAARGETATWPGVVSALDAELLLPLRALNECRMLQTMCGAPLPEDELKRVVLSLTEAVLKSSTGFSDWRYSTPRGQDQLRGLSDHQIMLWREPTAQEHAAGLKTHEDAVGELGFFWATKIGGPSHGFDYESQCILPLLANARHKVILVSDPTWTDHPVGRAHWRLLWSVGCGKKQPEPRLWLETVNADFEAPVSSEGWQTAVLTHAISKADAMGVPLSVPGNMDNEWCSTLSCCLGLSKPLSALPGSSKVDLMQAAALHSLLGSSRDVEEISEKMLLRASNAIVEASDYLSSEHDWVQDGEEITMSIARALYTPRRKRPLEATDE
ncbi:hypothetical protein AK812_SmicGene37020 [Symbiodinium microadriaticum]|uniref:Uncharacterized protein n=1 Tax=Symbiodinium microadriaticum TaxID=2951 RepID=A0A1Q9CHE3_SYMMI|nr:hypothetical protein AK812_SmicGene37020 [Symbiodinium microadriaticum]